MIKSIAIEKLFTHVPFYDRFRLVKEAGFSHLEFGTWTQHDIGRIGELLEEHGLRIGCFSGDKDYSIIAPEEREGFLDYLAQSLEVAGKLGCRHLVLHSNALAEDGAMSPSGNGASLFTKISAATRALSEGAKLAGRAGVLLVLEPISSYVKPGYFMTTTASAGDILRVVDSPNLRLLYDVYHMQMMEGDVTHNLRAYGDLLGYVHIGDVPDRCEPGTGELNFSWFKRVLCGELGYDGIFGFELYPRTTMEACLRAIHEF